LVVRNSVGVPGVADPGLQFCLRRLLGMGVALLGIRLSLVEAGVTGVLALPVVVVCIAVALLVVGALTRLLRLPRQLGTLIAVGTSICGITAIVAVARSSRRTTTRPATRWQRSHCSGWSPCSPTGARAPDLR
jgi:uncharacterized membrane protein YadS